MVSDPNFLPDGKIINIKVDGSGDFTKLSEAIDYLNGKWSNGSITIQFGEGTFQETEPITIDGDKFNISNLNITGVSNVDTILNLLNESGICFDLTNKVKVSLNDLKIVASGNKTSSIIRLNNLCQVISSNLSISLISGRGISMISSSCRILNSLTVVGQSSTKAGWGCLITTGSVFNCSGTIKLQNLIYGLVAYKGGLISLGEGSTISSNNVTNVATSNQGNIYGSY